MSDGKIDYRWHCVSCDRFRGTAFCAACGSQAPTRLDRDVDRLADLNEAHRYYMSLCQSYLNTAKAFEKDLARYAAMWSEEEIAKIDGTRKNTAARNLRWALAMEWAVRKLEPRNET